VYFDFFIGGVGEGYPYPHCYNSIENYKVHADRAWDVSRGRFSWVLSSKILPKTVRGHPYCSWLTAAAELLAIF